MTAAMKLYGGESTLSDRQYGSGGPARGKLESVFLVMRNQHTKPPRFWNGRGGH